MKIDMYIMFCNFVDSGVCELYVFGGWLNLYDFFDFFGFIWMGGNDEEVR